MSSSRYCVSSVEQPPTYHRKLRAAFRGACKRLNVSDSEIQILDFKTNRSANVTADCTCSSVERWLTWGEK